MKIIRAVAAGLLLFNLLSSVQALEKAEAPPNSYSQKPPDADEPVKPAAPTVNDPKPIQLEPIEVLGSRTNRIPDKQASETVISSHEIERATIQTTSDLARRVPNVTFVEAADRRTGAISIRGFVSNTYGNPAVITYVDDIPVTDWHQFSIDLYDVEQIAVVRGPHAETTHGASAEAGLIQVYTIQPSNEFEGSAFASYGNYNEQIYRAALGGPIVKDKLMFRLSALESKRDGFLKNTLLDSRPDYRDLLAGRWQLKYIPTPELEIGFTLEGQRARDGAQTYVPLNASDPFKVEFNVPGSMRVDSYLGSLKFAYTTAGIKVSSITTRRSWEVDHHHADLDFTPRARFNFTSEFDFVQWSQEFRVASTNESSKWKWLAGLYFEDRGSNSFFGNRIDDTEYIQAPAPAGLGLPFSAPVLNFRGSHLFGQAYAAFGQSTLHLIDQLDITFGLRAELHLDEMETHHVLSAPTQATQRHLFELTKDRQSVALLPKLAISNQINSSVSIYGSATEGYRPGGFAYLIDDPTAVEWKPEYLWNFETGLKSEWLDKHLFLDLTAFDSIARDYQVRRIKNFAFRVENADKTSSRGVEAEITARPIKGLELLGSFGYADAHFDRYTEQSTGQRLDGNTGIFSSKYTFSTAAQYLHPTGFLARAEYQGRSTFPFNEENTLKQRGFELFNAKLGFERKDYGIYIFGKNLFDQRYSHFGIPGPENRLLGSPGDPLQFGMQFQFKF